MNLWNFLGEFALFNMLRKALTPHRRHTPATPSPISHYHAPTGYFDEIEEKPDKLENELDELDDELDELDDELDDLEDELDDEYNDEHYYDIDDDPDDDFLFH